MAGRVHPEPGTAAGRARSEAKAQNEYADKTAPCYSWLFDTARRGSVYCDHEDELVALLNKIEADPRIEIVRSRIGLTRLCLMATATL